MRKKNVCGCVNCTNIVDNYSRNNAGRRAVLSAAICVGQERAGGIDERIANEHGPCLPARQRRCGTVDGRRVAGLGNKTT